MDRPRRAPPGHPLPSARTPTPTGARLRRAGANPSGGRRRRSAAGEPDARRLRGGRLPPDPKGRRHAERIPPEVRTPPATSPSSAPSGRSARAQAGPSGRLDRAAGSTRARRRDRRAARRGPPPRRPVRRQRGRAARAAAGAPRDALRRDGTTTLRVRIYPDEIHVDDLRRGLSDGEERRPPRRTGRRSGPTRCRRRRGRDFVDAVGADRAEWVAHATTPTNLAERGPGDGAGLPDVAGRGRATSSPAPARPLRGRRRAGRPAQRRRRRARAPRPRARHRSRSRATSPRSSPTPAPSRPGAEWLVDYDAAVEVGMAVTLELAGGDAADPARRRRSARAPASPRRRAPTSWRRCSSPIASAPGSGSSPRARRRTTPTQPLAVPARAPPGPRPRHRRAVTGGPRSAAAARRRPGAVAGLVGRRPRSSGRRRQRAANTALWAPVGAGSAAARHGGSRHRRRRTRSPPAELFRDHVRGRGSPRRCASGPSRTASLPVSDLRLGAAAGETTAALVRCVVRPSSIAGWRPPHRRRASGPATTSATPCSRCSARAP